MTGGWGQLASPFVRRGAYWLADGSFGIGPFGGSGSFGEPVAAASDGDPLFITDVGQTGIFVWSPSGAALPLGRPADTLIASPRDGDLTGSACALVATTTSLVTRAYNWTAATGFEQIPLLDGFTSSTPFAMSDDGTRVVGVTSGAGVQQGFFWSSITGVVSMQIPATTTVELVGANGDGTIVAGRTLVGADSVPFVWSLFDGLMTPAEFAASRGCTPADAVEFLDFNANGRIAIAKVGTQTVLLKQLGLLQCTLAGDCFAVHAQIGCRATSCCESVCAADSFCCFVGWDANCVEHADALCRTGLTCEDAKRADPQIVLAAYSACGSEIACSDEDSNACGLVGVSLVFPVVAGDELVIRASAEGGRMQGELDVYCAQQCGPWNPQSCASASLYPGCSNAACCATVCETDPLCCIYEWEASCAAIARITCYADGDLDYDFDIDASDLATLLSNWGLPGNTDIDGSGMTGPGDLAALLSNWR